MKVLMRLIVACAFFGLAMPGMGQGKDAACDLVDESVVAAILGAQPSKKFMGNSSTSGEMYACLFQTPRASFRVNLVIMNSADVAARTYANNTTSNQQVSFQPESGLGDAAAWWHIGTEAYGYTVRKGARVLMLDTRWNDAHSGGGLKERLRPMVQAAVRKL